MAVVQIQKDDQSIRWVDQESGNTVLQSDADGKLTAQKIASVARTDTSAKNLFTIPANAIIMRVEVWSTAASNASSTATLSIGKTGTNTFYINAFDVKGNSGQIRPTAVSNLHASVGTSALQIVGIYAETGTASSSGGPWFVMVEYYMP